MYLIGNVNSGQNYKVNSFGKNVLPKRNSVSGDNAAFCARNTMSESNVDPKCTKKGLIAAGIAFATVLAGVGIVIISRGRNKKLANKALAEIPDELKTIFAKLKDEKGEAFFNKGYNQIKKFMKLEATAPEKVIINANETSGFSIKGGFSPNLNSINYDNGVLKMNKAKQLDMLAHELKHSEQF
ncbi:MAG TPA: hypothetical protein PLG15_04480, partial [Candidatus Gastranaerophilaceae bacterium]|nr:hypothetical protein [Candidatus Gastranaerophilaceae bacterium]